MLRNNVTSMCSLIDNLVSMPPDKKVHLLPQERKILVEGLDNIFEILCEYRNRCDELYKGIGNASSDEIILEIEAEKNKDSQYVEDDDSEDAVCIGCETGADCPGSHSDRCNMKNRCSKYINMAMFL